MKKIAVFIYHLLITLSSLIFGAWSFIEASVLANGEYEGFDGLGAGIGAAVLIILGAILIAVALISLAPTVVSGKALSYGRKRHFVTCIVFEVIMLLVFVALTVLLISEWIAFVGVVLILLDTGAIILNALSIREEA